MRHFLLAADLMVETHMPAGSYSRRANKPALLGFMQLHRNCLAVVFFLLAGRALAGTTLDFWHSYVHAQTLEKHYGFRLAQYKRGWFWGSCGPSTKLMQWTFTFDLAGEGPVYTSRQISLSDDNGKPAHIVSGQLTTDLHRHTARIAILIESGGATNAFIGNGEYRIRKAER